MSKQSHTNYYFCGHIPHITHSGSKKKKRKWLIVNCYNNQYRTKIKLSFSIMRYYDCPTVILRKITGHHCSWGEVSSFIHGLLLVYKRLWILRSWFILLWYDWDSFFWTTYTTTQGFHYKEILIWFKETIRNCRTADQSPTSLHSALHKGTASTSRLTRYENHHGLGHGGA